jgi:iron complex transport system substrate-binding protein
MSATPLAAIAPQQMIGFGEDHQSILIIEILFSLLRWFVLLSVVIFFHPFYHYNMNKTLGCFLAFIVLVSCKNRQSENNNEFQNPSTKYANGFWIEKKENYRHVFVKQSDGATIQYRLIERSANSASEENGVLTIEVPIANIVCTSTTHIPLLDYLGQTDKLIGFPSTDYISSTKMRKRIDQGLVNELGKDNSLNIELLVRLQPSLVMAYSMGNDIGHLKKIQEVGIPVVINSEYLEQHPLGRAEWIKFMALFFGKETEADSIFNAIESEYLKTKKVAEDFSTKSDEKPTVLTGIPYGGTWYLPGGKNYAARFFEDAGVQYLWDSDSSSRFLQLTLETVYERASNADYWIGVGSFESYNELKSTDDRFAKFAAWQNKKVYTYNARIGPTGGNEYLELGYLRPDLILKDLIQITHPEKFPKPELFFYKELRK